MLIDRRQVNKLGWTRRCPYCSEFVPRPKRGKSPTEDYTCSCGWIIEPVHQLPEEPRQPKEGRPKFWDDTRLRYLRDHATEPNARIAAALGCSAGTVREKRKDLGLPRPLRKPVNTNAGFLWSDERLTYLHANAGKKTDAEIAEALGTTYLVVGARRRREKLDGSTIRRNQHPEFWTPDKLSTLHNYAGRRPDHIIAKMVGATTKQVGDQRHRLGLPAYGVVWHDEVLEKLGTLTDRQLAEEIGCHEWTVGEKRKERGIPAYCRRNTR